MRIDSFENIVSMLECALDAKRNRHMVGGVLLSVSMLFGGLAITVMTIKEEDDDE